MTNSSRQGGLDRNLEILAYKDAWCQGISPGELSTAKINAIKFGLKQFTSLQSNLHPQRNRYCGFYSFAVAEWRVENKKTDADNKIPCLLEPELTDTTFQKNWARLIQKIYEVDPLICFRCNGSMRVISFIEDSQRSQMGF